MTKDEFEAIADQILRDAIPDNGIRWHKIHRLWMEGAKVHGEDVREDYIPFAYSKSE